MYTNANASMWSQKQTYVSAALTRTNADAPVRGAHLHTCTIRTHTDAKQSHTHAHTVVPGPQSHTAARTSHFCAYVHAYVHIRTSVDGHTQKCFRARIHVHIQSLGEIPVNG